MKLQICLLFLFLLTGKSQAKSATIPFMLPIEKKKDSVLSLEQFTDYKIKDLEKYAGRKFTFKEKLHIKLLKLAMKKDKHKKFYADADPDKQATLSFIFALAALGLLIPGLLNIITGVGFLILIPILAIAAFWLGRKSRQSGKNFKNTFGYIVGGLIIVLGIIIAAGASSL